MKTEEKHSQTRREREAELRAEAAEQAFETFRDALRSMTTGTDTAETDAAESIASFDILIDLAKQLGRDSARSRGWIVVISYGNAAKVRLGPAPTQELATSLSLRWLEAHAGVISKEGSVKGVKLVPEEDDEAGDGSS